MELVKNNFEEIKKTKDPEKINEFLIELSDNPKKAYRDYIDYFINNLDAHIFEKVKLNLIFLIGSIGKIIPLKEQYLAFLIETYYTSDRWIRNEIIQTIGKISTNSNITEKVRELVSIAVNDDYSSITINALQVILNFKKFPLKLRKNIFYVLNSNDSKIKGLSIKILEKFLPDFNQLINSLDYLDNYKILKPSAIRTLLMVYFLSPFNLESFRKEIIKLNWEIEYKKLYLKEIDIYEKILLKNL